MASKLAERKCEPCTASTPRLAGKELEKYVKELGAEWTVRDGKELERNYVFKNFADALAFTNRVGAIAEREGHHPDICLGWGKVKLSIWTHAINGLSESDFILAAKADAALH